MTPKAFEYVAPLTLDDAISILRSNEDAKLLAGGQSLVPLMKLRLASPKLLIDINGLENLFFIKEDETSFHVGAMTRYVDLLESSISQRFPILNDSVSVIADALVRNRGTIGGNICHADPASDLLPAIIALNARLKIAGPDGTRIIDSSDFFIDVFTNDLKRSEILTEVEIPKSRNDLGGAYLKLSEISGGFATVGVGVQISLEGACCKKARISAAGVAPTPIRLIEAERCIEEEELNEEVMRESSQVASKSVNPQSDVHGSSKYRKQLVGVLTQRALEIAKSRAMQGAES